MKKKIIILFVIVLFLGLSAVIGNKLYWNYKVEHATKIVELSTNQVLVYQEDITIQKLLKEGKIITSLSFK